MKLKAVILETSTPVRVCLLSNSVLFLQDFNPNLSPGNLNARLFNASPRLERGTADDKKFLGIFRLPCIPGNIIS